MRSRIKTQDLVVLYTVKHLTMQEIADRIGMSKTAICKRFKKFGVRSNDGEWVRLLCDFCGKETRIRRCQWKKSIHHYCSAPCYYADIENHGYYPWRQGQRLARAIVNQYYRLDTDMVVHHKDGDNRNNDRSNLAVFKNQGEHMAYHRGKKIEPLFTF